MLRWAIDSLPLGKSLCESWDYSALQLNLLSATSVYRARKLGLLEIESTGSSWNLIPGGDFLWSDGAQVTGLDLLHGFKRLFRSNPKITGMLFSSVEKVEADEKCMRFFLKHADPDFGELLELPNLAPYRNDTLSSGPVALKNYVNGVWLFNPNPYWRGQSLSIQVRHVQDPDLNVSLFKDSQIDCTADTAFPFTRVDEFRTDLHHADTGLEFTIVCAPSFSHSAEVSAIISSVRKRVENVVLNGTENTFVHSFASKNKTGLRLVYDSFYPNREICEKLAGALSEAGFVVSCIEDDYYRPSALYDLRLLITRGPHTKPSVRNRLAGIRKNRISLFSYPSIRLDRFPELNIFTKLLEVTA